MRHEVVGLVLGAALIGGLIYAARDRAQHRPAPAAVDIAAIRAAAAAVTPGFVGLKRIGAWDVACTDKPVMVAAAKKAAQQTGAVEKSPPLPLSLGGAPAAPSGTGAAPASPPEKISLGRCRATQAFRRKDAARTQVALAVNFRIVGTAPGRLGLFVRLPEGKKGETLSLRFGKAGFKLPIANCDKGGCVAFAVMAAEGESELTSATSAELVLPAGPDGKKAAVRLAFVGLPAAVGAIRRAQP